MYNTRDLSEIQFNSSRGKKSSPFLNRKTQDISNISNDPAIHDKDVLLVLMIEISPNVFDKLIVRRHSNIQELAQSFRKNHNLPGRVVKSLIEYIESNLTEQMKEFVTGLSDIRNYSRNDTSMDLVESNFRQRASPTKDTPTRGDYGEILNDSLNKIPNKSNSSRSEKEFRENLRSRSFPSDSPSQSRSQRIVSPHIPVSNINLSIPSAMQSPRKFEQPINNQSFNINQMPTSTPNNQSTNYNQPGKIFNSNPIDPRSRLPQSSQSSQSSQGSEIIDQPLNQNSNDDTKPWISQQRSLLQEYHNVVLKYREDFERKMSFVSNYEEKLNDHDNKIREQNSIIQELRSELSSLKKKCNEMQKDNMNCMNIVTLLRKKCQSQQIVIEGLEADVLDLQKQNLTLLTTRNTAPFNIFSRDTVSSNSLTNLLSPDVKKFLMNDELPLDSSPFDKKFDTTEPSNVNIINTIDPSLNINSKDETNFPPQDKIEALTSYNEKKINSILQDQLESLSRIRENDQSPSRTDSIATTYQDIIESRQNTENIDNSKEMIELIHSVSERDYSQISTQGASDNVERLSLSTERSTLEDSTLVNSENIQNINLNANEHFQDKLSELSDTMPVENSEINMKIVNPNLTTVTEDMVETQLANQVASLHNLENTFASTRVLDDEKTNYSTLEAHSRRQSEEIKLETVSEIKSDIKADDKNDNHIISQTEHSLKNTKFSESESPLSILSERVREIIKRDQAESSNKKSQIEKQKLNSESEFIPYNEIKTQVDHSSTLLNNQDDQSIQLSINRVLSQLSFGNENTVGNDTLNIGNESNSSILKEPSDALVKLLARNASLSPFTSSQDNKEIDLSKPQSKQVNSETITFSPISSINSNLINSKLNDISNQQTKLTSSTSNINDSDDVNDTKQISIDSNDEVKEIVKDNANKFEPINDEGVQFSSAIQLALKKMEERKMARLKRFKEREAKWDEEMRQLSQNTNNDL